MSIVNKIELKDKIKELENAKRDIDKIIQINRKNIGFNKNKRLINKIPKDIRSVPYVYYNKEEDNIKYGVKMIPVCEEDGYDPDECKILRELNNIKLINIPTYFEQYMVNIDSKSIKGQHKFDRIEKIKDKCILLVTEYLHGGDLESFSDKIVRIGNIEEEINIWYSVIFQIVYTLAVLQNEYSFSHNDLHFNNILIDDTIKPGGYLQYKIRDKDETVKTFNIFNYGFIVKIWDMEFSTINNKVNKLTESSSKIYNNIPVSYDKCYDLHYIINNLLDLPLPNEIYNKISRLYNDELLHMSEITSSICSETDSIWSETNSICSEMSEGVNDRAVRKGRLSNDYDRNGLVIPKELLSNDFFSGLKREVNEDEIIYRYSFRLK